MKRFTIAAIKAQVEKSPKLEPCRRPLAFPGRKWPTKVAWFIQLATMYHDQHGRMAFKDHKTHQYIGKPNRLRAMEARNFLRQAKQPSMCIYDMFQATFDRGGLVAYSHQKYNRGRVAMGCGAFTAYHPHIPPPNIEIVEAFVKPLYVKYIGGMRLYSQKKTLRVEELDAYYEWYQKQFNKRLRRPKPAAMSVIANEIVGGEPLESEGPEPEPQEAF
jgi:hypothetical protein